MVYRIYVEKKKHLAVESEYALSDIRNLLNIKGVTGLRVVNRYDVEGNDSDFNDIVFSRCVKTVFSEPQLDIASISLDTSDAVAVFGVEFLPGQFDQRADSASQCIGIITGKERPEVKTAKIYVLYGSLTQDELIKIKNYFINPVECREASLEEYTTLKTEYPVPGKIKILEGFNTLDSDGRKEFISEYGLAMDEEDLKLCQEYFSSENRNPTLTEIRVLDTYWSDHCRHTTFLTAIDNVSFDCVELENSYKRYLSIRKALGITKPVCLMDIATVAAKYLKSKGILTDLDESPEINACTVKIKVDVEGENQDWLLLFKNETHNHPTEIEPFGGAATCIGGAIRDPLSGRAYVYAAMRVTGAGNPLTPIEETLPGKLPQRKICTTAAAGYSSYGNQVGLATGQVEEIYHDGYVAKRMEIGAVIGAVKVDAVKREEPSPGDVVILLGGRTGRDGCGGATGSSKSHTASSLTHCGAEVQKGNPPEERKIQRLFRNPNASRLIKRCNDFGAGGVSVAIGELAEGLDINLDTVKKKYTGLDGTELAISESQERMAVVVSADNAEKFISLARGENLEATVVARVTENKRLVMKWNGDIIVDLSRDFLNSNGAQKHTSAHLAKAGEFEKALPSDFEKGSIDLVKDLNVCSRRGLAERFDSTIGRGTVLMPFGGKKQLTPLQAMVHKIPVEKGDTATCSVMSYGFNPYISEKSPYHGAYLAVIESVSKLIATGGDYKSIHLTFQEYFEKLREDPSRWGKPLSALLGGLDAQLDLGIASIGGKDSMSGSFEDIDVPPTLVSFGVATGRVENVVSPEFKSSGHAVVWFKPEYGPKGLPIPSSFMENCEKVESLIKNGMVYSAFTPVYGGIAEGVIKSCLGNNISFEYDDNTTLEDIFGYSYGSFVVELDEYPGEGILLGKTRDTGGISFGNSRIDLDKLYAEYESPLEAVYPTGTKANPAPIPELTFISQTKPVSGVKLASPRVLIPVFPGTNCEYDTAKALEKAGAVPEIFVINNLTPENIGESVREFSKKLSQSQMVIIPGGFSGGDEPEGSGKFITAFFRNNEIKEEITKLLEVRDGLICGICNGFQASIKLGLVPYGRIIETTPEMPTLTFNVIGRHQSRLVKTKVVSNKSPWLMNTGVGEVYTVPISHGEGRFLADEAVILNLAQNGQIATQYVDDQGNPTYDILFNPNGSVMAVEGITSPDGRVLGKMGHTERTGEGLYKNVPGNYDMGIFRSAVEYYK
ncbi:MAG: phosphoribosylformylglycinamidine synthase [Clostridiales bacterium]|nr:phosphoribosylformylglycinamidine synthase [Clostridiales bacterium]